MNRSAMTGVSLTRKPRTEASRVYSPADRQQVTGCETKDRHSKQEPGQRGRVAGGSATVACGLQAGLEALAVVFIELKIKG